MVLLVNAIVQREGQFLVSNFMCFYKFMFIVPSICLSFLVCCFNRKLRVKRSIKVPAISNKVADIPPDEYSWRKYGQKPIKGSPHPR